MRTRRVSRFRTLALICLAILAAPPAARAGAPAYRFRAIARLGDPAPGGGTFVNDFEPYGINNNGVISFVADVSTGGEGVFTVRRGRLVQVARTGQAAPGGGMFSFLDLGRSPINDAGEVAFQFTLEPFTTPVGMNSGAYRLSRTRRGASAVVVPGVTPAPGGGEFAGVFFDSSLNSNGDLAFTGLVPGADIAPGPPGVDGLGIGVGVFRATRTGEITSLVSPGDPAPGGGTFDFIQHAWINDESDVAFGGHVQGEECITFGPQESTIHCAESVYLRRGDTGAIESIAHQGEPAPGGGTYRLAFGPILNNEGEAAFIGDLTPAPGTGDQLGVFLFSQGATIPVARPGDSLPGGGHMVRASFFPSNWHLNDLGDVVFNATLDTDDNGDGVADTGLYVSSGGSLRVVARTGTEIPGVGTVAHLQSPVAVGIPWPTSGAVINSDRQQVFFQVTLEDGTGVLLVATPMD